MGVREKSISVELRSKSYSIMFQLIDYTSGHSKKMNYVLNKSDFSACQSMIALQRIQPQPTRHNHCRIREEQSINQLNRSLN